MKKRDFLTTTVCGLIIFTWSCGVIKKADELSPKVFKSGDNITLVGNSITHQGYYLKNIMLYYITRHPDMPLYFFNAGTSGDTSEDVNKRMERDIMCNNSDIFIMMIGMNDAYRAINEQGQYVRVSKDDPSSNVTDARIMEKYRKETSEALAKFKTQARTVILFTPSIFDNTAAYETLHKDTLVNHRLELYGEYIKTLADDPMVKVVDMWGAMMKMNAKMQADNPNESIVSATDRVHPDEFGTFLMGCTFLKTLRESGIVSTIAIDAKKKKLTDCINAEISGWTIAQNHVTFDLLEKSLPFPIIDQIENKVNIYMSDFNDELNREILKIENLKTGSYNLSIDNVFIATFTDKQLAAGVNLATNKSTPQYKQAEQVHRLLESYRYKNHEVFRMLKFSETTLFRLLSPDFNQWDNPQACIANAERINADSTLTHWGKGYLDHYINMWKPNEKALAEELKSLLAEAYRTAQPKARHYEITEKKE